MPDQIKLLTARRAYEFRPDELRLSVLSTVSVQAKIQQTFNFQTAAMGTPVSLFGPTELTGNGLAFTSGAFAKGKEQLTPIRFMHFETNRIVIDVAAPSAVIDDVYAALLSALGDIRSPDGSPAIGRESRRLDYTEITAHFAFPIEALFAPGVADLLARGVAVDKDRASSQAVPSVYVQKANTETPFAGMSSDSTVLRFAVRQGFAPEERIYFSAAPLPSDAHLKYLRSLEALLSGTAREDQSTQTKSRTPRKASA
jgi:hypothetical protein